MQTKIRFNKLTAWLLTLVMLMTLMPMSAFAAERYVTDDGNDLEGVESSDYYTFDEAVDAATADDKIVIKEDVTWTLDEDKELSAPLIADGVVLTIDLSGHKLIVDGDNTFTNNANVTIKNGTLSIDGTVADGDAIFGVGNYTTDATLNLENVNVEGQNYSSAYAVFYVYGESTLNMTGGSVTVSNDLAEVGGVFKAESSTDGKINITGTADDPVELKFDDAKEGFKNGTVKMNYVDLDITGGTNAINGSALTVKNSTLDISGADGRALTVTNGDVTVENSALNFSDCSEGEIRFKSNDTLSVDEKSTLTQCTVYVDDGITGAKINDKFVTATTDNKANATVKGGVTTIATASENSVSAYTQSTGFYGEVSGSATASVAVELYEGSTKIATATTNTVAESGTYSWSIPFNTASADENWTVEWAEGYPKYDMNPDKVKLIIDGSVTTECAVQYNDSKGENEIVALAEGYTGGVIAYTTLTDAIGSYNGRKVNVLRDVTEDIEGFYGCTLTTNVEGGVTITNTYDNWVYMNDLNIGKGVTLKCAYIFYDTDGVNTIEGTLEVSGTFYHGYNAKTTIQNGGNVIVECAIASTIVRYNTDEEAGLYIYGDGNDETVEFKNSYYMAAYSGTFYAKDANIETGYFLLKPSYDTEVETDNVKYPPTNMTLDNSTLKTVGTSDGQGQFTANDNASITLKNGSTINVKTTFSADDTVEISADSTSSITDQSGAVDIGVLYTITVDSTITNGTVSADKENAAEGDEITLTIEPATEYELDTLTVKDADGNDVTVTDNKFTMPAKNVTVTATFKSVYAASVTTADSKTTKYTRLSAALTAAKEADGSTLKLLKDADRVYIDSGSFTLDLNGKTIQSDINAVPAVYIVDSNSQITIKDSGENGKIISAGYGVDNSGTLTIEGGIIEAAACVGNEGTLLISGGTFTAASTRGRAVYNQGTATITGGNLTGTYYGVYNVSNTLTIKKDATLSGGIADIGYYVGTYDLSEWNKANDATFYASQNGTVSDSTIKLPTGLSLLDESGVAQTELIGGNTYTIGEATAYTITFDANGGTVTPTSATTGTDGKLTELPTPTRTSYKFNGWFDAATGGNAVTTDKEYTENTTIYAQWTKKSSGGGSGSSTTTTTTKNDDGSTTKTTTNKSTGTTTETTTYPDGSTTKVETKKDGTVTTTEKDKDGNTTTTVENPDGSSATTEKNKDGSETVVEKDTDGTTTTTEKDSEGNKTVTTEKADGTTTTEETKKDGTKVTTETNSDGETTAEVEAKGETEVVIPMENADEVTKVIVTDKDGNETEVEFAVKDGGIAISVSGNSAISVQTGHICYAKDFTDIDLDAWYHLNIDYVLENGLFKGTSETTFAPNDNLTRAMLVTVLYRAEGEPEIASLVQREGNRVSGGGIVTSSFEDVDPGEYYANAVIWAKQNGIVNGVSETEFAPNENITREQIAAILYRYAIYKGMDAVNLSENLSFTDADKISEYAISALNWAARTGLIKGYEDNTVRPLNSATRAETAALLERFIKAN